MTDRSTPDIRILIVDDHAIVRAGLRMLLASRPGLVVVGEAANLQEALAAATREQPDIILLDLDLGGENGLDLISQIRATPNAPRVVLLTGTRDQDAHRRAVRLGAMGVVLKDQAAEVLISAVEQVAGGAAWLDPQLMMRVLQDLQSGGGRPEHDPEQEKIASLTEREREVVGLIGEGLTNKQLAQRLSISVTTVSHHLTAIFTKLGVPSRLDLVVYAYRHGLTRPSR